MDIEQGFNQGEKNNIIKIVNVTNSLKKNNQHFEPKIPCCKSLITDMSCQN